MSDYHILELSRAQDEARVAFHLDVPDTTNAAGVNYRTALVQYLGTIETVVPGLDTAAHGLDNGSVHEIVETVNFSANDTNADKRTAIETAYSARQAGLIAAVQARLEFWGWSGDVA
jgi:hypothetical protein